MNKEKGIYELLPSEPVDVAAMGYTHSIADCGT